MKKKKDFSDYLTSVLQNSMVTGIPQIAAAGNVPKKIVRALVFVLCVVGFVYQASTFMRMYWEYKTVIDVQVSYPKFTDLPAFTLCNINGIYRSRYCDQLPDKCMIIGKQAPLQVCACIPRLCTDGVMLGDISMPRNIYADEETEAEHHSMYPDYYQTKDELIEKAERIMVFDMTTNSTRLDDYESRRVPNGFSVPPVCYTFDSVIGKPNKKISEIYSLGMTTMTLNLELNEYDSNAKSESAHIAFHNARTVKNPFVSGYAMYAGMQYKFRLKKLVQELLPPPFETQCKDYIELWKQRGGRGPTTERECIQECQLNKSLELHGCVMHTLRLPHNERKCKDSNSIDEEVTQKSQKCVKENCRRACWEEQYQVIIEELPLRVETEEGQKCDKESLRKLKDQIEVHIQYNGMETTTYKYKPQFENIETFSYLGGYVGMWLGISLVAVFDFFETMVIAMKFPIRRLRAYMFKKNVRKFQVRENAPQIQVRGENAHTN